MTDAVPFLHVTDLYHPHIDPDDHFDLATAYGLDATDDLDLRGILVDYPPADWRESRNVDPGIQPIAQLNRLTGRQVPFAVGTPDTYADWSAGDADLDGPAGNGAEFLLERLAEAGEPVVINVVGTCTDVAIAAERDPDLFERNCRGIYLNAGLGSPDRAAVRDSMPEYNVELDPEAYDALFSVPCPLYWMPCFPADPEIMPDEPQEHGTYWRFDHRDVISSLSENLKKFFTYMYVEERSVGWLEYLDSPLDRVNYEKTLDAERNMWCTAGFLHAVGRTVTAEGEIEPRGDADGVFSFDPVTIERVEGGETDWHLADESDQFKFLVTDADAYDRAMTACLRTILQRIE